METGFQALYLDSVGGCSSSLLSFGLIVFSSIRFLCLLLCCAFLHWSLLLCFSLSLNSATGFTFPCLISLYQASLCFSKYCALLEESASRRARYLRCFSAADIYRKHGKCWLCTYCFLYNGSRIMWRYHSKFGVSEIFGFERNEYFYSTRMH